MPFNPINYGNIAAQGENILAARQRRDPNSMQNQLLAQKLRNAQNPGNIVDVGKTNPRDFTAESIQEARRTGDMSKLVRYQAPRKPYRVDVGDAHEWYIDSIETGQPQFLKRVDKELGPDQTGEYFKLKGNQAGVGKNLAEQGVDLSLQPKTPDTFGGGNQPPPIVKSAAELASDLETEKAKVKFKWDGVIAASIKRAEAAATERGEVLNDLQRMEASLPGLTESVSQLKKLATVSTSTIAGSAWDVMVKEMGFGSTEGATAQAKFIAIVNNQVLPLLRQTFGAAFTAAEGESLKKTMGDPNAAPEVKMAQLDSFIAQKVRDIQGKKSQIKAIDATTNETGETYEQKRQRILGK